MISSIGNAAAATLVPRPHEAAPGARLHEFERGRAESAKPGTARPGGGGPTAPLLDTATVAALQEHGLGDETGQGAGERKSATHAAADAAADPAPAPTEPAAAGGDLSAQEKRKVQELKRIDAEVRRHEAAHAGAGGAFAGSPSFTYQTGPDGKRYAVAGEVPIDTAPVAGDPEATIAKMRTVQRAANAPSEPSGQDRAVAATAARAEQQARAELAAERREELGDALGGEAPRPTRAIGPEAREAAVTPRPAGQDDSAGQGASPNARPFSPSVRGQADGGPGGVIQIATRRYGTAAALVGAGDPTGANASIPLGPFQATGTATPRIERFA